MDIVNFALTLEHLENTFYTAGLQNFSAQAFADAGFAAPVRGFYEQLSLHEKTHVDNLTSIIGADNAVKACTYNLCGILVMLTLIEYPTHIEWTVAKI